MVAGRGPRRRGRNDRREGNGTGFGDFTAARERLSHLIHGIAAIRQEHWYKPLESNRDLAVTPPSMPGQNLPCPPPTTTRFCHSHCQVFTRRRSQPLSTVA